ncbi:virB8 family protein [Gilvimarinus chinensis]|uniref:virB8 family protein n=1 Tax=Gilvimarinus chinensis TaxID=396005 RepID=UPI0003653CB1|nr:type IV secretion system protein [Gilvimarinus chinensis]
MLPNDIKDPNSPYYRESESWGDEKYDKAVKERRIGWMVAVVFGCIACGLVVALIMLIPLKEVVPYTIEVDRITGETQVKKPLSDGNFTQKEALTKYWIIKYVKARLGYDRQDLEAQYELVKMMSEKRAFALYDDAFDPKKPTSPFQVYGESNTVKPRIKSISFLDSDTATIRVDLIETINERDEVSPWVVTMSFQFTLEPRSEAERFENPLGFQTTKWRIDEEVEQGE